MDWSKGTAEPPAGVPAYDVLFLTTRTNASTYIIRYRIDPATNQGYVYIPGKEDPAYSDNICMILRGVEGKWFHAWTAWEEITHPLIAKAAKK